MRKNKRRGKSEKWVILRVIISLLLMVVGILVFLIFEKTLDLNEQKENVSFDSEKDILYESTEIADQPVLEEELLDQDIQDLLGSMSLEEKIAQMFFITPEALTGFGIVTATGDTTKKAFLDHPVGGIVYFAKNLQTQEQTKAMLEGISDYAIETQNIPIFLGVDEEGGRVTRVGKNPNFNVEKVDAMGVLAQQRNVNVIYEAGNTIGNYLHDLGFNVDFAPDTDVITNSQNQAIGDRSFGTDPQMVSSMAWAFRNGLHDAGVLATYKHFPGHGGAIGDTHTGYAYSYRSLEEFESAELIPFQSGSEQGIDFIMVSHISVPEVTGSDIPASLSDIWITDILRNKMNYQGIIITDSMAMGAICENYTSADATLLAIEAGCDMILMPKDFHASYEALLSAVSAGIITEERIDESVCRILKTKLSMSAYSEE